MSLNEAELDALAGLFTVAGRLKRLKRQGWVDRGVENPESVADHSYRLALMAMMIGSRDPEIDADRAVCLALAHDLPEALAGDVTPFDDRLDEAGIDRDALFHQMPQYSDAADRTKHQAEQDALREMTADLPGDLRETLTGAWEEYEAGQTREAQLVRQLDKLETWLQALEYRQDQSHLIIESFRRGTERDLEWAELRQLKEVLDRMFGAP